MSDTGDDNATTSMLEVVSEYGVPDPVQKGFLKAANRLLGAVVDIPAAWLEGFASDHRASADARRELQMAAAKKIASEYGGKSDLANRALAQQASRILRTQVNLEDVVARAAIDLASSQPEDEPSVEPSDDWLECFRAEAEMRSEEEVQTAFSRILAGEIRHPGTFSIRTVRAIGQMDQRTAKIFQNFANICVVALDGFDIRALSLGGNANQNALQKFGLSFSNLNVLQENGLLQHDYHSSLEYTYFAKQRIPFNYAGRLMILSFNEPESREVKVNGPALSAVGMELFKITQPNENKNYTSELAAYFQKHGISTGL